MIEFLWYIHFIIFIFIYITINFIIILLLSFVLQYFTWLIIFKFIADTLLQFVWRRLQRMFLFILIHIQFFFQINLVIWNCFVLRIFFYFWKYLSSQRIILNCVFWWLRWLFSWIKTLLFLQRILVMFMHQIDFNVHWFSSTVKLWVYVVHMHICIFRFLCLLIIQVNLFCFSSDEIIHLWKFHKQFLILICRWAETS
jgi:hypothetical protein